MNPDDDLVPMKCPGCPERNYYGRLVNRNREPFPKCDNCKRTLVATLPSRERP